MLREMRRTKWVSPRRIGGVEPWRCRAVAPCDDNAGPQRARGFSRQEAAQSKNESGGACNPAVASIDYRSAEAQGPVSPCREVDVHAFHPNRAVLSQGLLQLGT